MSRVAKRGHGRPWPYNSERRGHSMLCPYESSDEAGAMVWPQARP